MLTPIYLFSIYLWAESDKTNIALVDTGEFNNKQQQKDDHSTQHTTATAYPLLKLYPLDISRVSKFFVY
jgi:hypothetical protein